VQHFDLPSRYFDEGIIDWGPNLIQWTWQSQVGFVLDRFSFRIVNQFHYDDEGWGMTPTDKELITSDGTAILRFRNLDTFYETRNIIVKDGSQIIDQLNELEYVKGDISCQCLAFRSDCKYLTTGRACVDLDRSDGAAARQRANRQRVSVGWHSVAE